jgi:hypothetical protein
MELIQNWIEITYKALLTLWEEFVDFIPDVIGALIVFGIGWYVAKVVAKIVTKMLQQLRLDQIFEQKGWKEILEKADLKVTISQFIGEISKWILIIVFLLAAVEILGFVQFANFLRDLINWLPNLVIAVAIFVVAVIVGDILAKIARASVEKIKGGVGRSAEILTRWAVYIFATLAILMQLGIATDLIRILFAGLVAGLAIAFGIAFGLGGKDVATEFLRDLREKIR